MKYVVVLPYIVKRFRDACMENCKFENVLEIDNTARNMGIMASHNLGIEKMYEEDADWLIVMSAAVRFGDRGGLDFIKTLETTDWKVVEADPVYGWHLIAFHRSVIDKVGYWDTNFTPYGYDDLDYSLRIRKAFADDPEFKWEKVTIDITDTIMGHSLRLGDVRPNDEALMAYYENKWGMSPGSGENASNTFNTPFNDPSLDLKYFPTQWFEKWKDEHW